MSYLSQKVMSEVSVSWRHRSPSARSALPLTCTPSIQDSTIEVVKKHEKFLAERLFPRKILTQRGFPPSSPRGRVGLCQGKADPSLMVSVGVPKPGGSLDRRVKCRRVPQPRWVDARRNAKGGKEVAGGRQA
jgi:hypothetical protein